MLELNIEQISAALGAGSWPQIVAASKTDGALLLELKVPPDMAEFAGHFPGQPVLPGVLQIHWAVQLASRCIDEFKGAAIKSPTFCGMQGIKFNSMVQPGAQLMLSLEFLAAKQKLKFAYYDQLQKYSNGVVNFAVERAA